jgi:hypothetical protein
MDSRLNGSCTFNTTHFSDQLGCKLGGNLVATISIHAYGLASNVARMKNMSGILVGEPLEQPLGVFRLTDEHVIKTCKV